MPVAIDFHAPAHRGTYGGRDADASWRDAVRAGLDPAGLDVADVGCGGGVYSRAWSELGAASVVGVDSSAVMLSAAEEETGGTGSVRFVRGDAAATGLPGASVDVVFERALVHHVPDLRAVVSEARRLLRPGGRYLVQDRTVDDVRQPPAGATLAGTCSRSSRACSGSSSPAAPTARRSARRCAGPGSR